MAPATPKPYAPFDFDLAKGVMDQLIEAFEDLPVGPLAPDIVDEIGGKQGVYQLFIGGEMVYAGKASSLQQRLRRHFRELSGRRGVDMAAVGFKALMIHKNWAPSVHEDILISYYQGQGFCGWNQSGFGCNDPGRNRDRTETPEEHFDGKYRIRDDWQPEGVDAGEWNARELLLHLKEVLPFLFRYQATDSRPANGHPKYNKLTIRVPREGMTIKELIALVIENFPPGWQATFLPGRVILYEEDYPYPHATDIIRKAP